MTLMDLSRRSGVAASTISRIENRQTSPTFTVLMKIADGLSVPVSTLLAGPGPRFAPGCRAVTRAGTGTRLETAHGSYRLLADEIARTEMAPALPPLSFGPPALGGPPGDRLFPVLSGLCGGSE